MKHKDEHKGTTELTNTRDPIRKGRVLRISGTVVDIQFNQKYVPAILNQVII